MACCSLGSSSRIGSRRSWSISVMRSAALSGSIRESSRADSASRARFEELEPVGRVELFEDVRFELAVEAHGLNDLFTLFVAGLLDEVSDLSGMELRQLPVRDAQAR